MSAQFAGSRSLDERRRRRLASEWEQVNAPAESTSSSCDHEFGDSPRAKRGRRRKPARRMPLRRLISPRLWKHSLIALLMLAAGAGILWAGWESHRVRDTVGPAAERLVALPDAVLARGSGGLLLLLASQCALLICYVRSRSHRDFSGRYKIWAWAGGIGFLFSASVSLDLHNVWSRTLAHLLIIDFPNFSTLCWFAPAVGCGSILLRDLHADMRDCKSSVTFLRLALVGWGVAVVQLLGFGFDLPGRAGELLVPAAALLGHYSLFLALMLHTRFVIFVSAEPPDYRVPLWKKTARLAARPFVAAMRRRNRIKAEAHNDQDDAGTASQSPDRPERVGATTDSANGPPRKNGVADSKRRKKRKKPVNQKEAAVEQTAGTAPARPVGKEVSDEAPPPDLENQRVDSPHGTIAIPKGLTKRERRRLRKLHKQQQRQETA